MRRGHDALRFVEPFSRGGLQRPFSHVLVEDLDANGSVIADGPDRVQKRGDIELAIARQQAAC